MIFRSRKRAGTGGQVAERESPAPLHDPDEYRMAPLPLEALPADEYQALVAEIGELTARNREARDPEIDRRLLQLATVREARWWPQVASGPRTPSRPPASRRAGGTATCSPR